MLDIPRTLPDFYQHAMHVIYAVVIALSFDISRRVIIPIENIHDLAGVVSLGVLVLGYFIVVTSWIGYFKSINTKSHTEGPLGIARFGTDLFIVYLFYYLVSLSEPENAPYQHDIFLWIMPLIYGSYLLWDGLKYFEYRKESPKERKKRKRRALITFHYVFIFCSLSACYHFTTLVDIEFSSILPAIRDLFFIAFSIYFTTLYRKAKWIITEVKYPRKPLKAAGKRRKAISNQPTKPSND